MSVYIPPGGVPAVDPGDLTPADRRRLRGARGTSRGRAPTEQVSDLPACCVESEAGVCPQHQQVSGARPYLGRVQRART